MKKNIVSITIFYMITVFIAIHSMEKNTLSNIRGSFPTIKQRTKNTLNKISIFKRKIADTFKDQIANMINQNNSYQENPNAVNLIEDIRITSEKLLEELEANGKTEFAKELIERNEANIPKLNQIKIKISNYRKYRS